MYICICMYIHIYISKYLYIYIYLVLYTSTSLNQMLGATFMLPLKRLRRRKVIQFETLSDKLARRHRFGERVCLLRDCHRTCMNSAGFSFEKMLQLVAVRALAISTGCRSIMMLRMRRVAGRPHGSGRNTVSLDFSFLCLIMCSFRRLSSFLSIT